MPGLDPDRPFQALDIAVLTVSDTRRAETDTSGDLLAQRLQAAGHRLAARAWVPDDVGAIALQLRAWISSEEVQVILTTGGTGITRRDVTPEAVRGVLTKELPGFGELFRWVSLETVGISTLQSRALGGVAERTLVFALPGSTGACRDAWDKILVYQLDRRYRPCNFVELMDRL
jgi:molybdenum cofactor biosynthesis protein B